MSDYFHALDVNKEVLEKTTKKAFYPYQRLNKIIEIPPSSGNIYYYDFSKKESKKFFLGKFDDLNNSGLTQCRIVEGNEKFGAIYQYKEDKNIESIKLIDLRSRRVYKNDNISNIEIIKVVYIKDLKKFMAIDKNGVCYEIKFKENNLELKKYSKIETGDLTLEQPINGVSAICNDSEIYFISRNEIGKNKLIKNRIIKYNFKTKKTDFILNINENYKTRALQYFPKQNILILEKVDRSKEDGTKRECSDIYLAEIKNNKVNIFYKSKYKNEENKYSKTLIEKLGCKNKDKNYIKDNDDDMRIRINDKGDKLVITRNIDIFHRNINKNIKRQVVDYYYIKRD